MSAGDSSTGRIIVFSAPSGAGKTTLLDYLRGQIPGLVYSISATTRAPRQGEIDGAHYFFMSRDEFLARSRNGDFAETQEVHGNLYGTPKKFVDDTIRAGMHILMDIDVYGKKQFDRWYPQSVGILLLPPSLEQLEQRLRGRGTDSDETIRLRLENARKEIQFAREHGKYEYTIINSALDRAKEEAVALVQSIIGARE